MKNSNPSLTRHEARDLYLEGGKIPWPMFVELCNVEGIRMDERTLKAGSDSVKEIGAKLVMLNTTRNLPQGIWDAMTSLKTDLQNPIPY